VRPIARLALPTPSTRLLARRSKLVRRKRRLVTKVARAIGLWKSKAKSFEPVRATLRDKMAPAPGRCMYCEHSEGTAIDHFWPLSKYPERAFDWENYLWACSHCNSNDKRDQFPLDAHNQPLLIDPTASNDDPAIHLTLHPPTGKFVDRTLKGKESIKVFGLSRTFLETGRMDAWVSAEVHLEAYAKAIDVGDDPRATRIRETLIRAPHGSVLRYLLTISRLPHAAQYIGPTCLAVLTKHSEVFGWV